MISFPPFAGLGDKRGQTVCHPHETSPVLKPGGEKNTTLIALLLPHMTALSLSLSIPSYDNVHLLLQTKLGKINKENIFINAQLTLQAEQLSLVLLSSLVDKCDVLHCSVQTGDEAAREAKQ